MFTLYCDLFVVFFYILIICSVGVTGSNNSSKYFGSVDSSQSSQKTKGHLSSRERGAMEMEQSKHFKYVLQDPLWLLMANTDHKVMMTYQLPSR